jgi:predicted  nucleic acid-binding Zn-ribbon protein
MSDELKKFTGEIEGLSGEYRKLRDDFDKPGNLSDSDLDGFQKRVDVLREKHKELDMKTVNPAKGVLRIISYHTEQIEMALGKIERGINNVGELEYQTEALKELFEQFDDAKHDLKMIDSDLDDIEKDIRGERKKSVREAVRLAMKKTKLN